MKLFSVPILSVLLAYPVMAQETQTQPMSATISASEMNSEARSLYEAGDAAFDKDQFEDAFALFRKSSDLGYAPARYMLAECYASGRGVKEDRSKAAELWTNALDPVRKAAEAGDAYAMYLVGDYILKKYAGLNSSMPWIEDNDYGGWFQRAADRGYAKADFRLSDIRSSSASSAAARSFYLDVKGYRRMAEAGYAPAQYVMGRLYETGEGVKKDPVESLKWYRKAADGGWPRAIYRIGVYYAEGKVVEKDAAEAAKWYRKAADAGYPQAQYMYGRCLDQGEGVEKDVVEAVKWYRKAADQDLSAARSMLASCYANGRGVVYDIREAARWNIDPWHDSSDVNYHRYVKKRATSHLDPAEYEDYDNGLDPGMIFYAADMTGDPDPRASNPAPKLQLGDSYFYGRNGLEQNYAEAAKWYRKATEAIVGGGFYELGFCYEYGKGVEADPEEAEKWYRKAADARQEKFNVENRTKIRQLVREAQNGSAESAYQVGLAFASGTGVKQDMPEALKWFRNAAEGHHPGAQFELGKCYETGTGVPQDNAEAFHWYQAAAQLGYAPARDVLFRCYREGLLGVKQDPDAALYWETGAVRESGSTD